MNPEVKQQWLDALTGDDYTQGYGQLYTEPTDSEPAKHCALGVLCDLGRKAGLDLEPVLGDWESVHHYGAVDTMHHVPNAVLEWADITSTVESRVVHLNDYNWDLGEGDQLVRTPTFHKVAEFIRENL